MISYIRNKLDTDHRTKVYIEGALIMKISCNRIIRKISFIKLKRWILSIQKIQSIIK